MLLEIVVAAAVLRQKFRTHTSIDKPTGSRQILADALERNSERKPSLTYGTRHTCGRSTPNLNLFSDPTPIYELSWWYTDKLTVGLT